VLVVLARHAHSQLNVEHRVNGDPARPVHITADGIEEARLLGSQLANMPFDVCLHTRFGRTFQTAVEALAGRDVPLELEPLFDDVDVGALEGALVEDYRAWKESHARSDRFPGGESLDEAAIRYAQGYRKVLASDRDSVLIVCHEIPIRYALNAASGGNELDGPLHDIPNATPFLFDAAAIARAADRIELIAGGR
jgi:2,3-bisphosphoglycerate-dependent phosphoglycerate mutase